MPPAYCVMYSAYLYSEPLGRYNSLSIIIRSRPWALTIFEALSHNVLSYLERVATSFEAPGDMVLD